MKNRDDSLKNVLKRTEIKCFGNYIMFGDPPGEGTLNHDETLDEIEGRISRELEQTLTKSVRECDRERVGEVITDYAASSYIAGFYCGMKAGARLLLNLTDDSDLIF